ncbi:ABC transporter permease [Pasteurella bettyae]|uniref:ABC transporter permease n=1 Tax=Pasteurella bettyae TaxID=752 RepID=UPI003D2BD4A3
MFKLLFLDFKQSKLGSLLIILLIALSSALSIAINLQEWAVREGSTQAAERFDLIIGAPGSETQLVLSSVFLQPAFLSLIDYKIYQYLEKNDKVDWAAPLAFGDFYQDSTIVGTNINLVTDGGKRKIIGRVFNHLNEAVVGQNTGLKIGDHFSPIHGQVGDVNRHVHKEQSYVVVGIVPAEGNRWDHAIYVPIESVWKVHANHHDQHPLLNINERKKRNLQHEKYDDSEYIQPLGASAIVVKPKSFSGAYQLRNRYKNESTQAVFPAEVLVKVHSLLGDSKQVLLWISIVTQILMALALLMIIVLYLKNRRQQIAVWRIFGAPRNKIFLLVWLALVIVIVLAMLLGILIGWIFALIISYYLSIESGFQLPVYLSDEDGYFVLFNFIFAILVALIPSLLFYRQLPIHILQNRYN